MSINQSSKIPAYLTYQSVKDDKSHSHAVRFNLTGLDSTLMEGNANHYLGGEEP
jgi:hypothetical protein